MIEPALPGDQLPKRIRRSRATMQCHSCGRDVPADSWKCRHCGELLDRPGRETPVRKKSMSTCLLVVVVGISVALFIGVLAAVAVPTVYEAKKAANEAFAISRCETVYKAQEMYREFHGTYATVKTLEETGLLEKGLLWSRRHINETTTAFTPKRGYRFNMLDINGGESWSMTAIPVKPGNSGVRSFYVDHTGVVRNEMCTSPDDPPANAGSPAVVGY